MTSRIIVFVIILTLFVLMLTGCSGSPKATAQYYWSGKPQEERVPVSDQTDPAGAAIAPLE
jgi:hypothetical protein